MFLILHWNFLYPIGDYDLKVMRQEYYINRQKAVSLAIYLYYDCYL